MESSGFFVSSGHDRVYTPSWLAEYIRALVTTGVYNTELGVMAGEGMGVSVAYGRAWVQGYLYLNDAALPIAITTADASLGRVDAVMLRLDRTARTIQLQAVQGEYAAQPAAPAPTRNNDVYDLKLAEVSVPAGTTKITQSLIKDCRLDDGVCGITVSAVQHISTGAYMASMEDQFKVWFNGVRDVLDKDTAGRLLNLINKRSTRLTVGTATAGHSLGDCDFLCDGVDDQVEINQAIQALGMGANEVRVLAGNYSITAPVEFCRPGTILSGDYSGDGTVLRRAWASTIREGVINASHRNCSIVGLKIDGQQATFSGSQNIGIYGNAASCNITRCGMQNCYYAVYLLSSDGSVIQDNDILNNNFGTYVSTCNGVNIRNNKCLNNTSTVISISKCTHVKVNNNTSNNDFCSISVSGSSLIIVQSNTCSECTGNSGSIKMSSTSDSVILGNICNGNGRLAAIGISSGSRIKILGNTVSGYSLGISARGSNNTPISHFIVANNICTDIDWGIDFWAVTEASVTGNLIKNTLYDGITAGLSYSVVSGNICRDNGQYGIKISGDCNSVTGNTVIRGTGQPSDYPTSTLETIAVTSGSNNLIVGNNIMGKNYINSGTNSTFADNKYQ